MFFFVGGRLFIEAFLSVVISYQFQFSEICRLNATIDMAELYFWPCSLFVCVSLFCKKCSNPFRVELNSAKIWSKYLAKHINKHYIKVHTMLFLSQSVRSELAGHFKLVCAITLEVSCMRMKTYAAWNPQVVHKSPLLVW